MQPRPMAETSRPLFPSLRFCMGSPVECLLWSKVAVPVGGSHSAIHEEVAAGNEPAVRAHQQCADSPNLVWGAGASSRRHLDHAPVACATRAGQFVLGERGDN